MNLNADQASAIEALKKGNVAVIAGPGSGKTHTLVAAIKEMRGSGAKPASILCLTFTKKAAENLRARLGEQSALFVGTFHALAHRLLSDLLEDQHIMTSDEMYSVLNEVKAPGINVRELGLLISRAKNGSLTNAKAAQLTEAYNELLAERGWLDYDDLISCCLDQLQAAPSAAYNYIFVDEFQDTSPRQYELLQKLAGLSARLFVIGDPNQSIYRFRGADGSVFAQITEDFRPQMVSLHTNYRSAGKIVSLASKVFPGPSIQIADRTEEGMLRYIDTLDEFAEAEYVVRTIEQSLGGTDWQRTHHDAAELEATRFSDFAVLYRTRRQGELLTEKLRAAGLPVQCLSEESPYASPQAQLLIGLLHHLKVSDEAMPWASIEHLAKAYRVTLNKSLVEELDASGSVSATLHDLAEQIGLADEPITLQLENTAARFSSAEAFLAHLDTLASQEYFDPAADAVVLSTIHASKGLEFKHVFVAGCVEGVLPSKRAVNDADISEERRLFYVAITRARDTLTLLTGQKRGGQIAEPSRFLKSLDLTAEVDDQLAAIQQRRTRSRLKRSQQSLF